MFNESCDYMNDKWLLLYVKSPALMRCKSRIQAKPNGLSMGSLSLDGQFHGNILVGRDTVSSLQVRLCHWRLRQGMRPGDVLFQLRKAPIAEAGRRLKTSPEDIGHWQAMETCGFLDHFPGLWGPPLISITDSEDHDCHSRSDDIRSVPYIHKAIFLSSLRYPHSNRGMGYYTTHLTSSPWDWTASNTVSEFDNRVKFFH